MLAPGVVIAERFRLLEPLGEGGMGAVWRAHHQGLDIPCAVKLIRAEAAEMPEIRGRFEREAKAAASLRSPHVVAILDHGVWQGTPYIAMELLEGEDLGQRLARLGRLPPEEVASVVAQVCRALSKAHAAGLVHRDLKPANIFLARDDDREIAKVLDFGIAKANVVAVGGSATKTGSLLGTPYYMSPEQAQGNKTVDNRSDLWSLAVVAFETLTGQLPFKSEALGDLLMKIMIHPLPVPTHFAPLPPSIDEWWSRAASREPAGRFQTAKEFADSLAIALGVQGAASAGLGRVSTSSGVIPKVSPVAPQSSSQPGMQAPFGATPVGPYGVGMPAGTPLPGSSVPSHPALSNSGTVAMTTGARGPDALSVTPLPKKRGAGPLVAVALAILGSVVVGGYLMFGRGGSQPAASAVREAPPATASAKPEASSTATAPTATVAPVESSAPAESASAPVVAPSGEASAEARPAAPAATERTRAPSEAPASRTPTAPPKPKAKGKGNGSQPTDYGI